MNIDVYAPDPETEELPSSLSLIPNTPWIRVSEKETTVFEVNAHTILEKLFYSPDQYEGLTALSFPHHLGIFSEIAGGQSGGVGLIDLRTGEWFFSTKEFSLQHVLWVEKYQVFIGLQAVSHYKGEYRILYVIDASGKAEFTVLYRREGYQDSPDILPKNLDGLTPVDNPCKTDQDAKLSFD